MQHRIDPMFETEDLASKTTAQGLGGMYSLEPHFLGSKDAVVEPENTSIMSKTSSSLYDSHHQLQGGLFEDISPLVLEASNFAPTVTEKEPAHLDPKGSQLPNSLTERMFRLLRTTNILADNSEPGYMFRQNNGSDFNMVNNNAPMPDAPSISSTAISPSVFTMSHTIGAATGIGTGACTYTSLPFSTNTNIQQPITASLLNMQYYHPQQSTSSTNAYFSLPKHPNLAFLHTHSINLASNSNDSLYSNGKQPTQTLLPSHITINHNTSTQSQLPVVQRASQFAERQGVGDDNTRRNISNAPVDFLPPDGPLLCTRPSSNHTNIEPAKKVPAQPTISTIKKWNSDDELTFFRLILHHNGTKYTKFFKSLPNKPIKSLNNKWQIEKKRAQKNMYLDWKTVIVSLLCRYLSLLERSRGDSILLIRNTLSTVLSTIDPTELDSFDKSRHSHYSRALFRNICRMLGNEHLRFLDIDFQSYPV